MMYFADKIKHISIILSFISGNFMKMRVNPAKAVLSHETASAIRFGIQLNPIDKDGNKLFKPEFETTAFFCDAVGRWWELMDNRRAKLLFSKNHPQALKENFEYLEWFARFYASMKLHPNQGDSLKPSQIGVLVSTYSMINMVTELLESGHDAIYSSVTSQNALENLFSVYRAKITTPTPLIFKRQTKLIALGHLFRKAKGMLYDLQY